MFLYLDRPELLLSRLAKCRKPCSHVGVRNAVMRLERRGWDDYVFAYHDGDEIGPIGLSRIAKKTGLQPDDL